MAQAKPGADGRLAKECSHCFSIYTGESWADLYKFFYGDKSRKDGLAHYCRRCYPAVHAKKVKPNEPT